MLFSNKNIEDLQKPDEAVSLQNQVKMVRLQDKLGKQKFHEDMKNVFEPLTKSLENTSRDITKAITVSSNMNNEVLNNLNNKLLEILNDRGILSSYLMTPLSKITNPENFSQFKLAKDPNSNRVNDLLIKNTKPLSLFNFLLTFRDTGKEFELKGDLFKMTTNNNYKVDIASLADKKIYV